MRSGGRLEETLRRTNNRMFLWYQANGTDTDATIGD